MIISVYHVVNEDGQSVALRLDRDTAHNLYEVYELKTKGGQGGVSRSSP